MREQFEKLPEITELLIEAQFDEQTGEYVSYWSHKSGYLNGAWYAYQEQQKKIDEELKLLKIPHYGYAAAISSISVAVKGLEK